MAGGSENLLHGLDAVPWDTFRHAYGTAGDTPRHLRGLASGDAREREAAYCELVFSIVHQGSVYPAAVPCIRFLAELLERPQVTGKDLVLSLLGEVATGGSWHASHAYLLESMGVTMPNAAQEIEREGDLLREIRCELRRYAPVFVDLIAEKQLRDRAVPLMVALAPLRQSGITGRVRELLTRAEDEAARVNLVCLLGRLDREANAQLLRSEFETGGSVAMLAAAIELAILHEEVPEEVNRFLTETFLAREEALIRDYSRLTASHDYWPTLATLIAKAGGTDVDRCLLLMVDHVDGHPWVDLSHLRAMMVLAFAREGGVPSAPSDSQKRAVLALAVKSFARVVDLQQRGWPVLREFGLPTTREGIDTWLGLPDGRHPGFTLKG